MVNVAARLEFPSVGGQQGVEWIKAQLIQGNEIALLDVREEAEHANGHPLFASNLPLSRLELQVLWRVPRRRTTIVLFDNGGQDDRAQRSANKLETLGYSSIYLFERGTDGWVAGGGEPFIDVNAPSKAFGELVESECHTPSIDPYQLEQLLASDTPPLVVDARRYDEYHTMSIPSAISVPGAELALHVPRLAGNSQREVIVNCAGRTRSLIGTQSLINAGLPNPVRALRNGTIGWTLAGLKLDHHQTRRYSPGPASEQQRLIASRLAERAGVKTATLEKLQQLLADHQRTTYLIDVRSAEEFEQGHLPGALNMPGGQLVQETEAVASVRGARIVLVDDDGVRARLTGHWMAQMNWEVWALSEIDPRHLTATDNSRPLPPHSVVPQIAPSTLSTWQQQGRDIQLFDVGGSGNYLKEHIPGAAWVLRSELSEHVYPHSAAPIVLTCGSSLLAGYAAADLIDRGIDASVVAGGNQAWAANELPLETGAGTLLSTRSDRYARPYEGSTNPREAMERYLEWEYGLVDQLKRDATHGFKVLNAS